jgi:hypothetical protein
MVMVDGVNRLKRIRRIIDMSSFEGLIGGVDYGGE